MHPDEEIDKDAVYIGFNSDTSQVKFVRGYDSKRGATIMWLIANLFQQHPRAILFYVCSPADEQGRHRSITFGKLPSIIDLLESYI